MKLARTILLGIVIGICAANDQANELVGDEEHWLASPDTSESEDVVAELSSPEQFKRETDSEDETDIEEYPISESDGTVDNYKRAISNHHWRYKNLHRRKAKQLRARKLRAFKKWRAQQRARMLHKYKSWAPRSRARRLRKYRGNRLRKYRGRRYRPRRYRKYRPRRFRHYRPRRFRHYRPRRFRHYRGRRLRKYRPRRLRAHRYWRPIPQRFRGSYGRWPPKARKFKHWAPRSKSWGRLYRKAAGRKRYGFFNPRSDGMGHII